MELGYVNLYYIGGFEGEHGKQFVTARGTSFIVPKEGEFLRVRGYMANDILRRHPGNFTTNPAIAAQRTKVQQTYRAPSIETMSADELEELLAEKRALEAAEAQAEKAEEKPASRRGRPPKTEEPSEDNQTNEE